MNQNFQYRGELGDTSLAEILQIVSGYNVPGLIRAEQRGVVKRVWIAHGAIVRAASTDSTDWLGEFLRREKVLSQEQFDRTMLRRGKSSQRYGELLVGEGIMSPEEVYQAIGRQMEAIVWSLFEWEEGTVTFSIGGVDPEDKSLRVQLPIGQVILRGIKALPRAQPLIAKLGDRNTKPLPLYDLNQLISAGLDAREYHLLSRVDGQTSLVDLCETRPFGAAENARLLYAFTVLRLIGTQSWRRRTTQHHEIQAQNTGSGE